MSSFCRGGEREKRERGREGGREGRRERNYYNKALQACIVN